MPVTPTYPGVYIEEVSSGVHTITGVSTSITAFVGAARRGPINKAIRVLSYSDFERKFGGMSADSELSYAVRQFFLNGGSDAYVVRLADADPAWRSLKESSGNDVLILKAIDWGTSGNNIEVCIDYKTANPDNTFNLIFNYTAPEAPQENRSETFQNLSMNSHDPRYVENIVNGSSQLVYVERPKGVEQKVTGSGTSLSGDLTKDDKLIKVKSLKDENHDQFRVSVNGSVPIKVQITDADFGTTDDPNEQLEALCKAIENKVTNADSRLSGFTCKPDPTPNPIRIKMTSGVSGERSTVRVLPGERYDLANKLTLGIANGGREIDAAAGIRPTEVPEHGTLTSGILVDADVPISTAPNAIPNDSANTFKISLNGDTARDVFLGISKATGNKLDDRLKDIAGRIQTEVRGKQSTPAYRDFTCAVNDQKQLVLTSGTRGKGSSVEVRAVSPCDIAAQLKLLGDAKAIAPPNTMLENGAERPYAELYSFFIANRSNREGLYALDEVDLFNILCLPGVTDAGILQDATAYCAERHAILLIDAPKAITEPASMASLITGPEMPKSKDAAIYYPWVKIADPLNSGKLRPTAPSGTLAGLYARTDSTRGVWKAPAGTEATLVGVQGTTYTLTDGQNGTLNPLGVNCIRTFPVRGTVAWGARTLRGADQMADEWKYIPVRRTALFIEESLYRGTQWVVFEPNDEPLWAQIRLNVGAFMNNLFRQGAFQGKTPREAYFVKCDRETTTQNDINLGIVNIVVGFAPLKPAEFVIIQLQQMAGQIQV